MKASILYFTKTHHTKICGEYIAHGLEELGIETRCFPLTQIDDEFLKKSQIIIFGSPTYMAQPPYQIPQYFNSVIHSKEFSGKLAGAFATERFEHGGGQLVIQNIMAHCLTLGMLVYSGGAVFGQPAIHLGPVGNSTRIEDTKEIFRLFGKRMGMKALEIF